MARWLAGLIHRLLAEQFTGKITLNFHKGHISKRYEIARVEEVIE